MKRLRVLTFAMMAILFLTAFLGENLNEAERLMVVVVTFVLGLFPGANLLTIIKRFFKLEDGKAVIGVYIASGVIAAIALAVAGVIGVADLTVENIATIGSIFFGAATLAYRLFMKGS